MNSSTSLQKPSPNGQSELQKNVGTWDRLLSAGAGSLILTRYLGRSLPGTVLGAALAYRALSGHCFLYQSAGISTADDSPPEEVQLTRVVTIDASPDLLFDFFLHDTEQFASLLTPVLMVNRLPDYLYEFKVEGPFGNYEFTTRVVESLKPESFRWESLEGDVSHRGQVSFAPTSRGTEVRVDISYRVPGGEIGNQLARLTGMAPKETLERALKQLKAKFETGEVPNVVGQPMGAGKERLVRDGATV